MTRGAKTALLLAVASAAVASIPAAHSRAGDLETIRAHDAASGVELEHPKGWRLQRFGNYCFRAGPGVFVSNLVNHRFERVEIPDGCTGEIDLSDVPDAFVLLEVSLFAYPFGIPNGAPSPPLLLDELRRGGQRSCAGCTMYHSFAVSDTRHIYDVRILIGRSAAFRDRQAAYELLESVELRGPAPEPE